MSTDNSVRVLFAPFFIFISVILTGIISFSFAIACWFPTPALFATGLCLRAIVPNDQGSRRSDALDENNVSKTIKHGSMNAISVKSRRVIRVPISDCGRLGKFANSDAPTTHRCCVSKYSTQQEQICSYSTHEASATERKFLASRSRLFLRSQQLRVCVWYCN